MKKTTSRKSGALWLGALVAAATHVGVAQAGLITGSLSATASLCIGQDCQLVDGVLTGGSAVQSYELTVNEEDGSFGFDGDVPDPIESESGASLGFDILSGNVDPLLLFAISGTDPVEGGGTSFFAAVVASVVGFPAGTGYESICRLGGVFSDAGNRVIGNTAFLTEDDLQECTINGAAVSTIGPAVDPEISVDLGEVYNFGPWKSTTYGTCPPGGCTSFDILISFTNTGGQGDGFGLTGTHVLTAVPAPPVLALFGIGLAALVSPRIRRGRRQL